MTGQERPLPQGTPLVIPRLVCRDADAEVDFCVKALGAAEGVRRAGADGRTAHAVVTFGPAMVMIESEWPDITNRSPRPDGSSPVVLYLYVTNVDRVAEQAVAFGARVLKPAADQFWGDRTAWVLDPAGHVWTLATRIEETTEAQRRERLKQM